MLEFIAYCDGACEPVNPGGTATWGFVLFHGEDRILYDSGVVGSGPAMSNNVAEYTAVVKALEAIQGLQAPHGSRVLLRGDSRLWVRQLSGHWRVLGGLYVPAYKEARRRLKALRRQGIEVRCEWIPRSENAEADALTEARLAELGVPVRTH